MFYLLILYFIFILLIAAYNYLTVRNFEEIIPKWEKINRRILVSIIIPMRNEEENVEGVLDSIFQDRNLNYEVIVVNDSSTDTTLQKLHDYKQRHGYENLVITEGLEKPEKWVGKNFALWEGIEIASGEVLVFLDADVRIEKDTVGRVLELLRYNDAISIFPKQEGDLLTTQIANSYLGWWPLSSVPIKYFQEKKSSLGAISCGQFIAIRNEVYREMNTYEEKKHSLIDDVDLFRDLLKRRKVVETLYSRGDISAKMYGSVIEAIMGFSKSFYSISFKSLSLVIFWLVVFFFNMLPFIFIILSPYLLILIFIIAVIKVFVGRINKEVTVLSIIFHPLQMIAMSVIAILSVRNYFNNATEWKGRKY